MVSRSASLLAGVSSWALMWLRWDVSKFIPLTLIEFSSGVDYAHSLHHRLSALSSSGAYAPPQQTFHSGFLNFSLHVLLGSYCKLSPSRVLRNKTLLVENSFFSSNCTDFTRIFSFYHGPHFYPENSLLLYSFSFWNFSFLGQLYPLPSWILSQHYGSSSPFRWKGTESTTL